MKTIAIDNIGMVSLSKIKEVFNPRSDFSGVDELVKSIEAIGLLQPIVVRKNGDEFVIVDGAQRFRALKKLDQKETQVVLVDAASAEEAQMAANLMRSDLNVLERARGYERMVRLFPNKYNAQGISKMFATPRSTIDRLINLAKKIPSNFDAKIATFIENISFPELEMLAQVPNNGTMDKVIEALSKNNTNVYSALSRVAQELDYSCDALTTGKLVSAGRAFVIKTSTGHDNAYTTDKAAFKEAKEAYEKKHSANYGQADKDHRQKVTEKSEKQKAADRLARKKEKQDRSIAVVKLPGLFKKFIEKPMSNEEINLLGQEICEKHLDPDKCRRLWAAFCVKGCDKVSSFELRGKTWEKVFAPMITKPYHLVKLRTFLSLGWKEGKTPEQAWVAGMEK